MARSPVAALTVPPFTRKSLYPQPFAALVEGRIRHKLGDHFGLRNFGINLTHMHPGALSALPHHHSRQDEFIYVLQGRPTLIHGDEEHVLEAGDCCGFPAGAEVAHHLANRTDSLVIYLEIGDRSPGDVVTYPHDDLALGLDDNGAFVALHKDGTPY